MERLALAFFNEFCNFAEFFRMHAFAL